MIEMIHRFLIFLRTIPTDEGVVLYLVGSVVVMGLLGLFLRIKDIFDN